MPRWIIILGSIVIFILLAWYFSNIVAYVLVAGVLSIVGGPLVNLITKIKIKGWHIPRGLAAIVTMLVMALGALIFFIYVHPVDHFSSQNLCSH